MEKFFLLGALELRDVPQSSVTFLIEDLHVTEKQSRFVVVMTVHKKVLWISALVLGTHHCPQFNPPDTVHQLSEIN